MASPPPEFKGESVAFRKTEWAHGVLPGELHPLSRLILGHLGYKSNGKSGGAAWPSLTGIAEHLRMGRRTVVRHLRELEELGLVQVERTHRQNNRYQVVVPPEFMVSERHPRESLSATVAPGGVRAAPKVVSERHSILGKEPGKRTWEEEPPLPPRGGKPATPARSREIHLERAQENCRRLGCPVWDKITKAREKLLAKRMEEEGIKDPVEFWDLADRVLERFETKTWRDWSRQELEILLRVPGGSNPDHFQSLKEAGLPQRNSVEGWEKERAEKDRRLDRLLDEAERRGIPAMEQLDWADKQMANGKGLS